MAEQVDPKWRIVIAKINHQALLVNAELTAFFCFSTNKLTLLADKSPFRDVGQDLFLSRNIKFVVTCSVEESVALTAVLLALPRNLLVTTNFARPRYFQVIGKNVRMKLSEKGVVLVRVSDLVAIFPIRRRLLSKHLRISFKRQGNLYWFNLPLQAFNMLFFKVIHLLKHWEPYTQTFMKNHHASRLVLEPAE